jgi:hypothetical protein
MVQGARALTQDFEGGVGDDVAATAMEEDAVAAEEGEVSADPTGFGALPSYEAGDSWGARISDARAHVEKAFNAASKKAGTHAGPRIIAHHGYLHKARGDWGEWGLGGTPGRLRLTSPRCVCQGRRPRSHLFLALPNPPPKSKSEIHPAENVFDTGAPSPLPLPLPSSAARPAAHATPRRRTGTSRTSCPRSTPPLSPPSSRTPSPSCRSSSPSPSSAT